MHRMQDRSANNESPSTSIVSDDGDGDGDGDGDRRIVVNNNDGTPAFISSLPAIDSNTSPLLSLNVQSTNTGREQRLEESLHDDDEMCEQNHNISGERTTTMPLVLLLRLMVVILIAALIPLRIIGHLQQLTKMSLLNSDLSSTTNLDLLRMGMSWKVLTTQMQAKMTPMETGNVSTTTRQTGKMGITVMVAGR